MSRRIGGPALWGAAVVAGLFAFASLSSSASASSGGGGATGKGAQRVAAVRGLAAEAGLPAAWGDFFALVAWRESKGNAEAINDSESEAAAAAKAFERNEYRYEGCGHPDEAYTFGSGGWFGILPANGLAQLGQELWCLPPSSVLEPRVALAMAVGFARGLMRWDAYKRMPTWLNLRAMWGSVRLGGRLGGRLGDPLADPLDGRVGSGAGDSSASSSASRRSPPGPTSAGSARSITNSDAGSTSSARVPSMRARILAARARKGVGGRRGGLGLWQPILAHQCLYFS